MDIRLRVTVTTGDSDLTNKIQQNLGPVADSRLAVVKMRRLNIESVSSGLAHYSRHRRWKFCKKNAIHSIKTPL